MGEQITATHKDIHLKIPLLRPGVTLVLSGKFKRPIVFDGVSGTQSRPIVIRGDDGRIGSGQSYSDYRYTGNTLSKAHQAGGEYPGLYYIADSAGLLLRDCQWVVIEKLCFDGCWPTAVYIDNSQHLALRKLSIRGGTFAIGATGANTRHLLIEKCDWVQDTCSPGRDDLKAIRRHDRMPKGAGDPADALLWRKTPWDRIHKDIAVDIERDERAFDGDFFRAWTIAGYVVIRKNVICDAFNGVHFFNQAPESVRKKYARNVLIERNWFVRIADNCIEPELFAWNWTVRHNRFVDCHATFSWQMRRSGYFYVYGNLGWNRHRPGPERDNRGRVFKLPERHRADGPHYVVHNSWLLRGPVWKKYRISELVHRNNAIGYYDKTNEDATCPFGSEWRTAHDRMAAGPAITATEGRRFTKFWPELDISFDGDVIGHPLFPGKLRTAGYRLGPKSCGAEPAFSDRGIGYPEGLKWPAAPPAVPFAVSLPDKSSEQFDGAGHVVGAWQAGGLFSMPDPMFWKRWPHARRH